jgi:hypothetical protein
LYVYEGLQITPFIKLERDERVGRRKIIYIDSPTCTLRLEALFCLDGLDFEVQRDEGEDETLDGRS